MYPLRERQGNTWLEKEEYMFKEFKEFAMRGNVVDMATGIIIGGAFGTIVKSLVDDVIMPPIGLLLGGVDFSNLFVVLKNGVTPGPYAALIAQLPSRYRQFGAPTAHRSCNRRN